MAYSISSGQGFWFEWKIKCALSVIRLDSEEFVFDSHRWKLTFVVSTDYDYVSIYLSKLNPEKLIRTYTMRRFIEDKHKNPIRLSESCVDISRFDSMEIWYVSKSALKQQSDTYLIDGTLKFVIVILPKDTKKKEMNEIVSEKSVQTSSNMDTVACLETLSYDFQRLMDDDKSDVTLTCEGRSFSAHKNILSIRSEVFSAMFRSDMSESRSGAIEITDMETSILDQFLRYIYSGQLSDLSNDTAPKLYRAADMYAIDSLKKLCSNFLMENLSRENACEILVLSDTHDDKCLKECVLHFIANIELLRNKDIWFQFYNKHPKLASEVMHHMYDAALDSKSKETK